MICDDNPLHLDRALALVRAAVDPSYDVRTCSDGISLLREIEAGESAPDIVILDIKLGKLNGIRIAGEINHLLPDCQVIFLTGYSDYASEAYVADHIWFVLKDQLNEYLPAALEKAMNNLSERQFLPAFLFRSNRKIYRVALNELLYVERVGRKYRVVGQAADYGSVNLASDFSDPLWKGHLVRCHQGYWVNTAKVYALDRNDLVMVNGDRIPISRTYRKKVRELFFASRRL